MITNFEQITAHLTKDELKMMPILISEVKKLKKKRPMKASDIVNRVNSKCKGSTDFNDVRLRKLCNLIRRYGILPLIATSSGYYVSYDKIEIELQIKSLKERASAIRSSARGLKKFL